MSNAPRKAGGTTEHFGVGHPRTRESVLAMAFPDPNSGCWLWTGKIGVRNGYGAINFNRKRWLAHRLVYTLERGDIPSGLQLDHLCRNRACVNPDHLEPVTAQTNIRRGSVFKNTDGKCHECGRKMDSHARGCGPCKKRKYRERHPDRVAAYNAAYWMIHRDKYNQRLRDRRAAMKSSNAT